MKKAMLFAAAMIASGAALADIVSANVVGYQQSEVSQNLSPHTATFSTIGSNGMNIQAIIPSVTDGEIESGDFAIQLINSSGRAVAVYTYVLGADIGDDYADGWYEEDWDTMVEKTFEPGESFLVYSAKAGSFTYAGQVITDEVLATVRQNLSVQGNLRPMPVDIQSIVPEVTDGEVASGDFSIQLINSNGRAVTVYTYVLGADIDDGYADGWYEEDWETMVEKTFAAGEGFLVYSAVDGYLRFPAL